MIYLYYIIIILLLPLVYLYTLLSENYLFNNLNIRLIFFQDLLGVVVIMFSNIWLHMPSTILVLVIHCKFRMVDIYITFYYHWMEYAHRCERYCKNMAQLVGISKIPVNSSWKWPCKLINDVIKNKLNEF